MSKPVNPALIGGFSLGALALLVAALLIFGGAQDFNADKIRFVVYFDSSLNGLEVGAPVKMQGVKIGQVKEISLQFDPKGGKIYKPVVVEIDRNNLNSSGGGHMPENMSSDERIASRDNLVKLGMRARLETQSLLTGLLYVDLNFYPDKPPMFASLEYKGLLEIPSLPTATDELRNTAEEVAQKLRALPLDEIVQDFASSLREIKVLLASEDVKKSQVALAETLVELQQSTKTLNKNLEPILLHADKAILNSNDLVKEAHDMVQELQKSLPGLLSSSDKTMVAATAALQQAQTALKQVDHAVGPSSALTDTLNAIKQAARSIRDLGDYLERHPEAILSGKQQ
ncbi:MlaD family protein [Methylomonas methanica]|uniref:Mammalian cell entry related domain protein n=1 Tax=Methylomonas methanica (strain DSM 25384 / MC09) TaxID=857087 RepID=G0A3P5_METMM|nr:MlaD family protein [Methylomonas methanica]AEG01517.1 Mammalian cell entry related domain protein [Methylomonas methanica MC09]